MCFDPKKDGKPVWETIHLFAANAVTPEQRSKVADFIRSLVVMYPCKKCRLHTVQFLQEHPIENYMESAQLLLYFTWLYHESVNQKLNKPLAQRWTWSQMRDHYMIDCEDQYRIENNHPKTRDGSNNSDSGSPPSCGECEIDDNESTGNNSSNVQTVTSDKSNKIKRVYYDSNEF